MSEINKTKKEVKENIKKMSSLSKDEQIKKLTALAKKLAKDLDDESYQCDLTYKNLKREKEEKQKAENDIRTIADILNDYKPDIGGCSGCCSCNRY